MKLKILEEIVKFYVESSDFNGISYWRLKELFGVGEEETNFDPILIELINEGKISVNYTLNPHIKQFKDFSIESQINAINTMPSNICLYPSETILAEEIPDKYLDRPFTRMLYFGKPQLEPFFFDISILEQYYNDPRYSIFSSDYSGSISYISEQILDERDQILLETFGIGYDKNNHRVVAVYLRYLHDLTPEHQLRWKTYLLENDDCEIVYEYYQNTIAGEWADNASIYQAFIEELFHINQMVTVMFGSKLFKNDFKEDRPQDFRTIFIPTRENFYKFIHILDKMMSENIDKNFFRGKLELEGETIRTDGKVIVNQKGTIQLFEEWLRKSVRLHEEEGYEIIINPFKEIRKIRQKPAHSINHNSYDRHIFKEQNEIIKRCYEAIRTIRLVFTNHPAVREYQIPDWLFKGNIRIF
ncbi:hypothetical protein [Paenibacillus xylanexedens]|uniref:hypothetical protein n=1 Tax=Paenibacillus xylanexedens TaxID=528191 RepID=UPI00119E3FEE|nr:hypothetical protein [Paenibacillus xylanexedens]